MNIFFQLTYRFSIPSRRNPLSAALFLFLLLLFSSPACAAKVLIVGDTQYAMVADVVSEIQLSLRTQSKEYATAEVKGRLGTVVEREDAQVVVALGMDAVGEAMRLPPSIAVVYGLVVVPPRSGRANVTGVYMSPPVSEYVSTVRRYLPALSRVSVVGSQSMMKSLSGGDSGQVAAYNVGSSSDLVNTVNRLVDARVAAAASRCQSVDRPGHVKCLPVLLQEKYPAARHLGSECQAGLAVCAGIRSQGGQPPDR